MVCRALLVYKGSEIRVITFVLGRFVLILKTVRPARRPTDTATGDSVPFNGQSYPQ